jgi:hypothetical protein
MKIVLLGLLVATGIISYVPESSVSHSKAAMELYKIFSPREQFVSSFTTEFDVQIEKLAKMGLEEPKLKKIKTMSVAYAEKIADDPELEEKRVELFVKTFSEDEIKELTQFYRTPTGKKALRKLPELTQQAVQLAHEYALKYQPEFPKELRSILAEVPENSADPTDSTP